MADYYSALVFEASIRGFLVRAKLRPLFEALEPHKVALPGRFGSLEAFRRILIVRCVRPLAVLSEAGA